MSLDGNGNYTLPAPQFPVISGDLVRASDFNIIMQDIANALSSAFYRDGQATATQNLPMGGKKLTGLGAGSSLTDSVTYDQVFNSPAFQGIPTAPTAAFGTATTQIATTDFVAQQAFSSVLPGQTTNAGKFLFTNGTSASWQFADISSINTTVTASTTLTGSHLYVPVQMTAIGQAITLPAATTILAGGLRFIIDNTQGTYPIGIRDNTGVLLAAIGAGGEALTSLKDNTTAAGVWSVVGNKLEPGLVTVDSTFSSTYASTFLKPFVALDNDTSLHFAALASGFAAFLVDNTGKVVTTPVTVDVTASSVPKIAFKVSSTQAIVFYGASNDTLYGVVLTISGTSPSLSLAVGTAANSGANTNIAIEDCSGAPKIAQLTTTSYLVSWATATGAGNTSVMAIGVSGTTVTFGAKADIIAANNIVSSTATYMLTTTTAAVLYKSGAAAPYANNAVVVTVTGTSCAVGTPVAATNCQSSQTSPCASVLLSATALAIADDNNTTQVTVSGFTFAGVGTTAWTALNVETGLATNLVEYTTDNATRYTPHLSFISATSWLLWYFDSSGISRAVVLSVSAGTITAGGKLYNSISSGATSGAVGGGMVLPQGTSEFVSIKQRLANTAGFQLSLLSHKISGTTITQNNSINLERLAAGLASNQIAVRLASGIYVLHGYNHAQGMGGNELLIFSTNGTAIDVKGWLSVPPISNPAHPLQIAANNRIILIGAAREASSINAASTYQLRLLNVEIAL